MDARSEAPPGFYAGWFAARGDLLAGSVDRVFALLAEATFDDEGWRLAVGGETMLWRAIADAGAPPVPEGWSDLHRRSVALLALLVSAGDDLGAAVGTRDPDLLVRSMETLDEAETTARTVLAEAFRLSDGDLLDLIGK